MVVSNDYDLAFRMLRTSFLEAPVSGITTDLSTLRQTPMDGVQDC
jgi:hypothetical protein